MMNIEEWGPPIDGAQLAIGAPKKVFAPGELIPISIVLKNRRDGQSLRYLAQSPWQDYRLNLSFLNRQPVPLTLFGRQIHDASGDITRVIVLSLAPNQTMIDRIPITRLFDMTLADVYELTVSRQVERTDGNDYVPVMSNRIEIEISDATGEVFPSQQIL